LGPTKRVWRLRRSKQPGSTHVLLDNVGTPFFRRDPFFRRLLDDLDKSLVRILEFQFHFILVVEANSSFLPEARQPRSYEPA
jgi:hypothetical protein